MKPLVRAATDMAQHPRPTVPCQLKIFLETQHEAVLRGTGRCVRIGLRTEGDPFGNAEKRILERVVSQART